MKDKLRETMLSSEIIYSGSTVGLKVDQVRLPNGRESKREVVTHKGAVAVVPVDQDNRVLLIKQFRYPAGQCLWEIPAGKLEQGEEPLVCAQRELAEEISRGAREWTHLTTFFTTPGFSNEVMHIFLARELYFKELKADDDEFIELHTESLDSCLDKISNGEIKDAKTIIGLMLAWQRLHK